VTAALSAAAIVFGSAVPGFGSVGVESTTLRAPIISAEIETEVQSSRPPPPPSKDARPSSFRRNKSTDRSIGGAMPRAAAIRVRSPAQASHVVYDYSMVGQVPEGN